jgi:hypothetical protein
MGDGRLGCHVRVTERPESVAIGLRGPATPPLVSPRVVWYRLAMQPVGVPVASRRTLCRP